MMFLSTKTNANEVHRPKIKGKRGCQAHEQRKLRLLGTQTRENEIPSTKTNTNEVHKQKIKGKLCCKVQEQRQMRLLSTRTSVNDVAQHKNKGK